MDAELPNRFQRFLGPAMLAWGLAVMLFCLLQEDAASRRLSAYIGMAGFSALGLAGVIVHGLRGVVPMRGRWIARARDPGLFWVCMVLQVAVVLGCLGLLVLMRPVD